MEIKMMGRKVIFHIDVNSAFLSWEAVYRIRHLGGTLDLRTVPSAVGGDVAKRHGIILAKSIPAKKYQVKTGETLAEALQKCPGLVIVPPNYELYEKCSNAFLEILRGYSDRVEQYSIDEAFVDMTGTGFLFGAPVPAACSLKDEIKNKLGFTVNVGVSENKLLAKMAGDFQKPDRVHTLFPDEIEQKMWPLPVEDLFFVGRATAGKLHSYGIRTVGELAHADRDMLRRVFHSHGDVIWNYANGRDVSDVLSAPVDNKGYGNSMTTPFDVRDAETAKLVLLSLAETVGRRIRGDRAQVGVVSVSIRYFDFTGLSHQRTLPAATDITREIYGAACTLFDEMWDGAPVRHLGIHTGRVSACGESRQLGLFDGADYEKQRKLDRAVDSIRRRFGADAVKRAAFLQAEDAGIDHMGGGISREKRSVDYERERVL